jgi:hypothetical protein
VLIDALREVVEQLGLGAGLPSGVRA